MATKDLFKVGDTVRISKDSQYYGTSDSNPSSMDGTITEVRPHSSYVYRVMWHNGETNSYPLDHLYLVSEKAASDLVEVPLEFVMEAYKGACSDWKKKIKSEVPDLYAEKITVHKEFVKQAYDAADTSWKKLLEKQFKFLRGPECMKLLDAADIKTTAVYYKPSNGAVSPMDHVSILHGVAGTDGIPENARHCGFYLSGIARDQVVVKEVSNGVAVYFLKK